MRQLLIISALLILIGCAPSQQPEAPILKEIEISDVASVEVAEGTNKTRTYQPNEYTSISIKFDEILMHITVHFKTDTVEEVTTYHYPADALIKFVTNDKRVPPKQ